MFEKEDKYIKREDKNNLPERFRCLFCLIRYVLKRAEGATC